MATRKRSSGDALLRELRQFGLGFPGAHLKSPWPGHLDLAVNDKTFAYLPPEGEPFTISCKLPRSSAMALLIPGVKPAAYGLGRSGWVAASFPPGGLPPVALFKAWIDESYRAQAPRSLVKQLDAPGKTSASPSKAKRPPAPGKRARAPGKRSARG
jgi:hypothetical protein